jgi:hypothetical protein
MTNETIIRVESIPEKLPLRERNEFQRALMENMIGEKPSVDNAISWADMYGKQVSDIIDNNSNEKIRSLIMEHKYLEAVKEIAPLL